MLEIGKVAWRKQPKSHEKDANFGATLYYVRPMANGLTWI